MPTSKRAQDPIRRCRVADRAHNRPSTVLRASFAAGHHRSSTKEPSMSSISQSTTRRSVLAGAAAAGALTVQRATFALAAEVDAIRPFRVAVPDEALVDLRRRIAATRWPERETVSDRSQGV